ncbi:RNA 2',3'-cyclic phosphodiesterase [Natribacillus halophilus]|uniref:RNA 2',3'-cyclic phosphodiesterase n=1 Tax=Natribacillus halophilus TaxID=549003 RepID=A0A1G8NIF9_9BACI|nr:RNA 2',3'-cyclic phosphodiesterase [Natribacillus halophilus]SDI79280.1 2'-5' RNA ligase [Natribacillus halophilus]
MVDEQTHYFLALPVPESVRKQLHELTAFPELQNFKSMTHVDDYHITLFFLGGVDEGQLTQLQKNLPSMLRHFSAFDVQLNGVAVFGNENWPRVLFADVKKIQSLMDLQAAVMEKCVDAGLKKEKRPFRPHITIAKRWKHKEICPIETLQSETRHWKDIHWQVQEVGLYAVRLGQLPRYQFVTRFPLQSV